MPGEKDFIGSLSEVLRAGTSSSTTLRVGTVQRISARLWRAWRLHPLASPSGVEPFTAFVLEADPLIEPFGARIALGSVRVD